MNFEAPQNPAEEMEAQLTALLLGELPPEQAKALREAMDRDKNLAELYARLKLAIDLVRETAVHPAQQTEPQPASPKLSAARREKLLQQFKTVAPKEFQFRRWAREWAVPVAMAAGFVALLAVGASLFLPNFVTARSKASPAARASVSQAEAQQLELGRPGLAFKTWALDHADQYPMQSQDKASALPRGGSSERMPAIPPSLSTVSAPVPPAVIGPADGAAESDRKASKIVLPSSGLTSDDVAGGRMLFSAPQGARATPSGDPQKFGEEIDRQSSLGARRETVEAADLKDADSQAVQETLKDLFNHNTRAVSDGRAKSLLGAGNPLMSRATPVNPNVEQPKPEAALNFQAQAQSGGAGLATGADAPVERRAGEAAPTTAPALAAEEPKVPLMLKLPAAAFKGTPKDMSDVFKSEVAAKPALAPAATQLEPSATPAPAAHVSGGFGGRSTKGENPASAAPSQGLARNADVGIEGGWTIRTDAAPVQEVAKHERNEGTVVKQLQATEAKGKPAAAGLAGGPATARSYPNSGQIGDAYFTTDPEARRVVTIADSDTSKYVGQVLSNLSEKSSGSEDELRSRLATTEDELRASRARADLAKLRQQAADTLAATKFSSSKEENLAAHKATAMQSLGGEIRMFGGAGGRGPQEAPVAQAESGTQPPSAVNNNFGVTVDGFYDDKANGMSRPASAVAGNPPTTLSATDGEAKLKLSPVPETPPAAANYYLWGSFDGTTTAPKVTELAREAQSGEKTPNLGDLPLVGRLFRSEAKPGADAIETGRVSEDKKLFLTGSTTLSGDKRALLKSAPPAKAPEQPAGTPATAMPTYGANVNGLGLPALATTTEENEVLREQVRESDGANAKIRALFSETAAKTKTAEPPAVDFVAGGTVSAVGADGHGAHVAGTVVGQGANDSVDRAEQTAGFAMTTIGSGDVAAKARKTPLMAGADSYDQYHYYGLTDQSGASQLDRNGLFTNVATAGNTWNFSAVAEGAAQNLSWNGNREPGAAANKADSGAPASVAAAKGAQTASQFRTIKVDPKAFDQALHTVHGFDWGAIAQNSPGVSGGGGMGGGMGGGGGLLQIPRVNVAGAGSEGASAVTGSPERKQGVVREFFNNLGADFGSGSTNAIFFNEREGTLLVYAPPKDQETIQRAMQTLRMAAPEGKAKSDSAKALNEPAGTSATSTRGFAMHGSASPQTVNTDFFYAAATQPGKAATKAPMDTLALAEAKFSAEGIEKALPQPSMVEILDRAVPPTQPSGLVDRVRRAFGGKVESTARIKLEQDPLAIAGQASTSSNGYDPYFLQTQFEVIQSEKVLGKVVDNLKLNDTWSDKYGQGKSLSKEESIAQLRKDLQLRPYRGTDLVEIKVKSDQPEEAARLANAVADAYQQEQAAARQRTTQTHRVEEAKHLVSAGKLEDAEALLKQVRKEDPQNQEVYARLNQIQEARFQEALTERDSDSREKMAAVEKDWAVKRPRPADAPVPQPEVQTSENAFSTFSLNVSDVSFKLAAASLEKGVMPDIASVRSEEFINAFDYRDPEPAPGVPIGFAWERSAYPFAQNRDLLRFSVKTAAQGRQADRPLNIVLLLDNSGSMERADRVQIIHEALRILAAQLQPQDKLSIVTFARTAQLRVDGVPGTQAAEATARVSEFTPEGGTNLEDAMNLAYQTALRHYLTNGVNRVVLLTDGAANLGDVEPERLQKKVETYRKQGVALDCFGIGWEGYNDDLLEMLTRHGDGRYGFVNTPEEAEAGFATQLAGALQVAASDMKVQVEFNPERVTAYRQVGYAKHQLTKEQFRDNTVNAAQIAAAESGNALYVIAVNPAGRGPLAMVRARYRIPGTADYREHEWEVPFTGNAAPLEQGSPAIRLAATAAAFSEWLAASPFAGDVTANRLLGYLRGVPDIYGPDGRPKRLEWMIRQAQSLEGK